MAAAISTLTFSTPAPAQFSSAADYIPPGSCAQEVANMRGYDIDADLNGPWIYRHESADMAQTPRVMLLTAKLSDEWTDYDRGRGVEFNAGYHRIRGCAYRKAAANVQALVDRRAPNGLKHFVTQSDCGGEQTAYAAAYADVLRHDGYIRVADSYGREMAAAFVEGVAYLHVLGNNGRGLTAEDYKAMSKPYDYSDPVSKTADALRACLFSLAYQRGAASQVALATTASIKPAAPPPVDPCSGDTLAALNREISDIDARLDRFMSESAYAKAEGLKPATPMLEVTLWGLQQNIAAIRKYCPASQKARDQIADFESSLKHAQAACDQIQAGNAKCAAVEPEKMM